jgi:hypothetical protein
MTQKKSVDELKKLAHPALRYVELVTLAGAESPNSAHKIAMARWPRRQAKACRFLAILRRDHPKAFMAFIHHQSTLDSEQARGQSNDTANSK